MTRSAPLSEERASPASSPQLLEEAGSFLRTLHQLQQLFSHQLAPRLEAEHHIDVRLYFLLKCIERGTVYPGAISKVVGLPNSIVSRHLDQLVERGLIERSLDPEDSRRIKLNLTRKGLQIAREANHTVATVVGQRLARLSAAKRKDFLASLAHICSEDS